MDIDILREYCLELPHVTEDVKWESLLCFLIGNKIFTTCSINENNQVAFKVAKRDYDVWLSKPGIIRAPYFWKAQWVRVEDEAYFGWKDIQASIDKSYELVMATLPKKVRESLAIPLFPSEEGDDKSC